jgi:tetratricopeptide (TPR) repeat protein
VTPLGLLLAAAAVPGGVYHTAAPAGAQAVKSYLPNETCPFVVRSDGTAEPLADFDLRFGALGNVANPNAKGEALTDRQAIQARLAAEGTRPSMPGPAAGAAADLLRLGNDTAALNALAPFARQDPADFRVLVNYAHAFALRGEWDAAARFHEQAVLGRPGFPKQLPGIKPEQLAWLQTVEKRYYTKWLAIHKSQSARKPNPETEEPFPLFGDVKFVNVAGAYEPGNLGPTERQKLPKDAVAIVQQLLLWAPGDTSLYWLLGELYAADGQLEDAKLVFDRCVDARSFSNRKLLKDHRTVLIEKLATQTKPAEAPAPPADNGLPPKSTVYLILAVFVPVAVLLAVFQLRVYRRKLARRLSGS